MGKKTRKGGSSRFENWNAGRRGQTRFQKAARSAIFSANMEGRSDSEHPSRTKKVRLSGC